MSTTITLKNNALTVSSIILLSILAIVLYSFYDTRCLAALCIIRLLHFLFLMFIVLGPFIFKKKQELQLYIIISIFMMIHWVVASDVCALTLAEQYITGRCSDDTFIGQIVKPVYNITNKQITLIAVLLLMFAIVKYIYCSP